MRHRLNAPPLAPALIAVLLSAVLLAPAARAQAGGGASARAKLLPGDYIVAVVNTDSVTATEVEQRVARIRAEAAAGGPKPPPEPELRKQVLDGLIEERVLATYARDNGVKVDDVEIDHAVGNIAAANKMTPVQLRERLRVEGLDYGRFRENLRDQIMIERIREREVVGRIKVTDSEIADYLDRQRAVRLAASEIDLAQILVTVPDGASAEVRAQRQARAQSALDRVKKGEPFELVCKEISEDSNKAKGGEMGSRPIDRYPDLFADAVRDLKVGAVTPTLLSSGAGFHILKVISKGEDSGLTVTQTRVRHILLRPSARLSQEAAERRLAEFRAQIDSGKRRFEDLAREFSEDASAPQGGDLGWAAPGNFVPEFETAMNKLPSGGLSEPFVSRFGVHLLQVVDRKEVTLEARAVREQARTALREQKFEGAYTERVADLRAKAFVEMREAPLR